jgi:hypothetical protein
MVIDKEMSVRAPLSAATALACSFLMIGCNEVADTAGATSTVATNSTAADPASELNTGYANAEVGRTEWRLEEGVDQMSDEAVLRASRSFTQGGVRGTASVECEGGKKLTYNIATYDAGTGEPASLASTRAEIRLETYPRITYSTKDRRYNNALEFVTPDTLSLMSRMSKVSARDALEARTDEELRFAFSLTYPNHLALLMGMSERVRIKLETARGPIFVDIHKDGSVERVLAACSVSPDNIGMASAADEDTAASFEEEEAPTTFNEGLADEAVEEAFANMN